jgi:hypothetical protein
MLGSGAPGGGAFYVSTVIGALLSGDSITNIAGNGFNIYYNPFERATRISTAERISSSMVACLPPPWRNRGALCSFFQVWAHLA